MMEYLRNHMTIPTYTRLQVLRALVTPSGWRTLHDTLRQGYCDKADLDTCRQSLKNAQEQADTLRRMLAEHERRESI